MAAKAIVTEEQKQALIQKFGVYSLPLTSFSAEEIVIIKSHKDLFRKSKKAGYYELTPSQFDLVINAHMAAVKAQEAEAADTAAYEDDTSRENERPVMAAKVTEAQKAIINQFDGSMSRFAYNFYAHEMEIIRKSRSLFRPTNKVGHYELTPKGLAVWHEMKQAEETVIITVEEIEIDEAAIRAEEFESRVQWAATCHMRDVEAIKIDLMINRKRPYIIGQFDLEFEMRHALR